MKLIRYGLLLLICGLALSACTKHAKPTPPPPVATAPAPATTPPPAVATAAPTPVVQVNPLDDPASPLANRVVYFDFDKSDIKPEFVDELTAHAKFLIANPDQKIRIEGYTDERGTWEYNIALGDRRAQAVSRFLLFQGVSAGQIQQTVSYGEAHPVDAGHTETAWAKNRRALIVYIR